MIVTAGKTNVSAYFYIIGDAGHATPGEPITGLLFSDIETGGSASYARQGAARVDLTLKTLASASAAHDDGGFILVDDTNMPGLYRCDYPDAAFATGVDQVILQLVVASGQNAVVTPIMVDLTDVDLRDSVRAGMTALPNAAADGAGGLPISDAGELDIDTLLGYLTAAVATATEMAKVPKSDGTVTWNATALASINAEADTAITDGALATAAELAKVPKSDGTTSWNATALAAINAEADTALTDYDPPTNAEIPTAIEIADAFLDRDMSTGTDSGSTTVRTPRQALRFLRNKWSLSGTTLTVTKEDDTTATWTSTVTATAGADPITANDPA